ncbi:tannase/feruloyl esterase family alpha/beta hydrolase [Streptomyces sp. NPDC051133]|uniref:tannase/feruloyl esterase family alpha/beta hydrolase n=1 Tax=Streptomyces sp. NPDC051133 TaxID=3155521 RepID=UPI0034300C5E
MCWQTLGALRTWVEHGRAPRTLPATLRNVSGEPATRGLCRYPQASRYDGHGDPKAAASLRCVPSTRH